MNNTARDMFGSNVDDECPDGYFASVLAFAEKTGQVESLHKAIRDVARPTFFGQPTRFALFKDFAPYSFSFSILVQRENGEWEHVMNGGIIYHGPHDGFGDGGGPSFSVSMTNSQGWQVHT